MLRDIMFDATPLDYIDGSIRIYTVDREDCADMVVRDRGDKRQEIVLRLDRGELVELITAASKALANLNG